ACLDASSSDTGIRKSKSSDNKVFYGFHLVEGKSGHDMEDYHVAEYKTVNCHVLGLFAIFDGHLGDRVPSYLKDNLFNNILGENVMQLGPDSSTAVTTIVINGRDLWVANIGDSRAILYERGSANQLTVDHERLEERSRIEKQGRFVTKLPGDDDHWLESGNHFLINGRVLVLRSSKKSKQPLEP
ncbi:probable protein phosphatase 2C 44, partial [Tanacetum coccineum]